MTTAHWYFSVEMWMSAEPWTSLTIYYNLIATCIISSYFIKLRLENMAETKKRFIVGGDFNINWNLQLHGKSKLEELGNRFWTLSAY